MNQVIQVIIYIYFKEEALVPVLTKTFVIVGYIISLHHVFIFKSVNVCVNTIPFDVHVYHYDAILAIKADRKD